MKALELARSIPHAGYEAAALANLGGAERELGQIDAAIDHMDAGLAIRRTLATPGDFLDDLAHLALVSLMAGDAPKARALMDEFSESLATASPAIFMPQFAFWVGARAYKELDELERARAMLARAHAIVIEQAEAIANQDDRARYMDLAVNREVTAAIERNEWPAVRRMTRSRP
jgi:tetratricopeptide (TPR) repeat protein